MSARRSRRRGECGGIELATCGNSPHSLDHIDFAQRRIREQARVGEGVKIERTVSAEADVFGKSPADAGRLLQAVAAESARQQQIRNAGTGPTNAF